MSMKKLAIGITIASTVCLAGSKLALASGNGYTISSPCPTTPPSPLQAYVYSGTSYTGTCWLLELRQLRPGNQWAGYDTSEGLPNDTIRSVKVGSEVRLKLFWAWFYTRDEGAPLTIGNGVWSPNLGTMGGNASAARLESISLGENCATPPSSSLIFWDRYSFSGLGDCTVLAQGSYPHAVAMAYRNDNASAFKSSASFNLYDASNYGSYILSTPSYSFSCGNMSNLCGICGICPGTNNADNKISSVN
jgi:hypothetical protein